MMLWFSWYILIKTLSYTYTEQKQYERNMFLLIHICLAYPQTSPQQSYKESTSKDSESTQKGGKTFSVLHIFQNKYYFDYPQQCDLRKHSYELVTSCTDVMFSYLYSSPLFPNFPGPFSLWLCFSSKIRLE